MKTYLTLCMLCIIGLFGATSVTAQTACAAPSGTSTINIKDVSASFKWSLTASATQYQIRYSTETPTLWVTLTVNSATATAKLVTGLSQLTNYKWQIRAKCGTVWSSYSVTNTFTTKGLFFKDLDADGQGDATISVLALAQPTGYVLNSLDCNDNNAAIFVGASEVCNGFDDNCDALADDADPSTPRPTWYADNDADNYGRSDVSLVACFAPANYVADSTDCNDNLAYINPGQPEVCNNIDDNCDGYIDADNIPLTLTCPPATACTDPNSCTVNTPNYSYLGVSPNDCTAPNIIQIPAAGSPLAVGPTSVLLIASDAGVFVTCIFTVTVTDCQAPSIQCPPAVTMSTTGCNVVAAAFSATASDNCSTTSVIQSPASGSLLPVGSNVISLKATDLSGNMNTCTVVVSVVNATPDICNGIDDDCDGQIDEDINAAACPIPAALQAQLITSTTAKLVWQGVPCAQNYIVQRRVLGTTNFTSTTIATNTVNLSGLMPSTTYQARVRSSCGVGIVSSNSGFTNFTTLSAMTAVPNAQVAPQSMQIVPNPAQKSTSIQWNNVPNGDATLAVTDLFNRTIIHQHIVVTDGQINQSLDVSMIPAGIYIVQLRAMEQVITAQLIKN